MNKFRGIAKGQPGRLNVPNGFCHWCGKRAPPERYKGAYTWCSDECGVEFSLRTDAEFARVVVFDRDRGVCKLCTRDCHALENKLLAWLRGADLPLGSPSEKERRRRMKLAMRFGVRPLKVGTEIGTQRVRIRTIWHVDHTIPVNAGGGGTGLENLRTLCRSCHSRRGRQQGSAKAAWAKPKPVSGAIGTVLTAPEVVQFLDKHSVRTTQNAYRGALARYFHVAEIKSVAEAKQMTPPLFAPVLRLLERKYKRGTVTQTLIALRQWHQTMSLEDPSVVDPTAGQKRKSPKPETGWNVLRQGDAARLLEHIESPRDRAVLLALLFQGWRASELAAMTWACVKQEVVEGQLTWVAEWYSKRHKHRLQGLQPIVLESALGVCQRQQPTDPFIAYDGTTPLSRFDVYNIVQKYTKQAGFKVSPHGLRATYISSVIQRKGIEAARQLVGHEDIKTTQRYSRWKIDRDDVLSLKDL
jgi:site-specific recombinase XerD